MISFRWSHASWGNDKFGFPVGFWRSSGREGGIDSQLLTSQGRHYLGFDMARDAGNVPGYSWRLIAIPYGFFLIVLGVSPAIWLMLEVRRRERRRKGLCTNCGYDLRGSSERCPECGMRREDQRPREGSAVTADVFSAESESLSHGNSRSVRRHAKARGGEGDDFGD
jgi:hypothetical protein